jgi:general stress protein CsbA
MLEEIIATFLSLFSALTCDIPGISREMNVNHSDQSSWLRWEDKIHREYGSIDSSRIESYAQLGYELQVKSTYTQSLLKSLKVTVTMTVAGISVVIIGVIFIYFDLRTCDLCCEWLAQNNTVSSDVMKIRLLGNGVEVIILNLFFPMILTVLFGWKEFKRHYSLTIVIGLLAGVVYTLYLSFLLLYDVFDTKWWYRVPGNVMFAIGVIWGCAIVLRKIKHNKPTISYSDCHIFTVVSFPLLSSFAMAMFYRYAIIRWFNSLDNVFYKFIIAMLTPTAALVPTALCRHIALWRASEIVEPERSFTLVYFMRAGFIVLYRIMQTEFKNIWLFVGLSILSGVSSVLKITAVSTRRRIWARVIKFLNKICCIKLQVLPQDTPHHRRLKADIEIQNILFENNSLMISQTYILLYMITNFENSGSGVFTECFIRIAIGLGIEFLFNFLSNFVRIHWHDIPIARVWSKYWKRHLCANAVVVTIIVCYFTKVLLTVFQGRVHSSPAAANYTIRNCTLPYQSWR